MQLKDEFKLIKICIKKHGVGGVIDIDKIIAASKRYRWTKIQRHGWEKSDFDFLKRNKFLGEDDTITPEGEKWLLMKIKN